MRRKLIITFGLLGFIIIGAISVIAAFSFFSTIDGAASSGKISITSSNYLCYTQEKNESGESQIVKNVLDNDISMVTCYATEKKGFVEENDEYFHLNQLGFEFSFKTDIDVRVRIHVRDAWISHKVYPNGSVVKNYISKDKLEATGVSPFYISDGNWFYDETTGYAYLKSVVQAHSSEYTYSFQTNSDYFYTAKDTGGYRESVLVETSFIVDIVQANRAEQKWGVNLESILS